jgi:hypothetical protein
LFKAIDNKKKSVIIEGKTKPPVSTQAVLGSKKKMLKNQKIKKFRFTLAGRSVFIG